MRVASYLGFFKVRPLKYIINGEIQSAPKEILKADITEEFIAKATKTFKRVDPALLKNYYLVLKSDYESWASYDYPLASAFIPVATFMAGTAIPRNFSFSEILFDAFVIAAVAIAQLAYQLRLPARKRAKAILFIHIIDDILKDRQGAESLDMKPSIDVSRVPCRKCVKVRVTDRGETVVSTISSSDCSPKVEIEYDFEKSL